MGIVEILTFIGSISGAMASILICILHDRSMKQQALRDEKNAKEIADREAENTKYRKHRETLEAEEKKHRATQLAERKKLDGAMIKMSLATCDGLEVLLKYAHGEKVNGNVDNALTKLQDARTGFTVTAVDALSSSANE